MLKDAPLENYQRMDRAARDGTAYAAFQHNAQAAQATFGTGVTFEKGLSRDLLPQLPDGAFDMVYLDGSKAYDDAAGDIREGLRLIRDGGILCGAGLEVAPEELPELESLRQWRNEDILQTWDRRLFHPGVTLAVADVLGRVGRHNGFWLLRKRGEGFEDVQFPDGLHIFRPRFWSDGDFELLQHVMKSLSH